MRNAPEDQLGNWLIYNGTFFVSQHWFIFTEAQLRLWEVASNLNETLLRVSGHYAFNHDVALGGGYLRADTWPYEGDERERIEHRIYEQFMLRQEWGRSAWEHRYRLEQRWFDEQGSNRYSNRVRYRVQATIPINRPKMEPKASFINAYNEFFIGFAEGTRSFDQNRLYVAAGHQFTHTANLQLGVLWQARSSADFIRLQIFYTHNFDFRDR